MHENNPLLIETITCDQCGEKSDIMEQSPLDSNWYFYCNGCRYRVDVSPYEPEWGMIVNLVKRRHPENREKEFGLMTAEIERRLEPCECCGGRFRYEGSRRCLYCANPLPKVEPGQHVWPYVAREASNEEHEKADDLINEYTLEPRWKNIHG